MNTNKKPTHRELRDDVVPCAGALRALGVDRGDTVVIYMPMVAEIEGAIKQLGYPQRDPGLLI